MKEEIPTKWEKTDFMFAHELEKFMSTPTYKWLKQYWLMQREAILIGMKKAKSEDSIFEKVGQLKGFDYAVGIPDRIMQEFKRQVSSGKSESAEPLYETP